jgi:DNA modification methylase
VFGYDAENTSQAYRSLEARYERDHRAIKVDFRRLVSAPSKVERATHLLHTYPAKLLAHIPFFFLANDLLCEPGGIVIDPFGGSGTVALEALLSGRNAISADSNPFARLLTSVKTMPLDHVRLGAASKRLISRIPVAESEFDADVVNLEHWFYPHVVRKLSQVRNAIYGTQDEQIRNFFWICFSATVRKVSLADPRLSVPVKIREGQYPVGHFLREKSDRMFRRLRRVNVHEVFNSILAQNLIRIERIASIDPSLKSFHNSTDARSLINADGRKLPNNSIDLVITSPPYPGAQKYIRACSLSLGWLGLCQADELPTLKRETIGREEFRKSELEVYQNTPVDSANRKLRVIAAKDPVRAAIAGAYLNEMHQVLVEVNRVLRPGGYMVLVIANGTISGESFYTERYLRILGESLGLEVRLRLIDEIRSRGLMTKRNKTANMITREFVILFEKPS